MKLIEDIFVAAVMGGLFLFTGKRSQLKMGGVLMSHPETLWSQIWRTGLVLVLIPVLAVASALAWMWKAARK